MATQTDIPTGNSKRAGVKAREKDKGEMGTERGPTTPGGTNPMPKAKRRKSKVAPSVASAS